jgi:hypothetical protein
LAPSRAHEAYRSHLHELEYEAVQQRSSKAGSHAYTCLPARVRWGFPRLAHVAVGGHCDALRARRTVVTSGVRAVRRQVRRARCLSVAARLGYIGLAGSART